MYGVEEILSDLHGYLCRPVGIYGIPPKMNMAVPWLFSRKGSGISLPVIGSLLMSSQPLGW